MNTLLILGASGDLTSRLLLPGLGSLLTSDTKGDLELIGAANASWGDARWRQVVATSFASVQAHGPRVDAVVQGTKYFAADVTRAADLRRLLDACQGTPFIYFALPPAVSMSACKALGEVGIPGETRLVLEKPFGTDEASARSFNALLAKLVPEEQIFRVDHFLGAPSVLNILGVRFTNRLLEPLLNADHVARIDVIFDESLALEGRAVYYDGSGAMVDMMQSHALQVLALLTMDAPATLSARDVRDTKSALIHAIHLWNDDPVKSSRRARYTAGQVDGRQLPSYVDEEGVDPSRMTETYARVVLEIRNSRWAGVPVVLRAGKALDALRMEVRITFKAPPLVPAGFSGQATPDCLTIGIDPARLELQLNANGSADPTALRRITLDAVPAPDRVPWYAEVLRTILDDDPVICVRGDTAVDCWRIIDPVRDAWKRNAVPMDEYVAGSRALDWDS